MAKRVLVCGGRDYVDRDHIWNELSRLDIERGLFAVVIHGYASGVDSEAAIWARTCGYKLLGFRAEWQRYGRAAGPLRNQRMLDDGKPDLVIALPGGRGTADMIRRARAAGVEVIEVICDK